jgi:hypothetical protein
MYNYQVKKSKKEKKLKKVKEIYEIYGIHSGEPVLHHRNCRTKKFMLENFEHVKPKEI